jgi:hypothetical protein
MLRLPDDIEEFLITGQHRRAIHALASRRCITPGQARDQVRSRVFEMLIETGGDGTEPRAGNLEQVQAATGTRQHR